MKILAKFYSAELDGLRFGAALLVFFHHAPPLPFLLFFKQYGWVGVDLFLAISAFLLTRLLHLEWQTTGKIQIWAFFVRRSLRIWPLFFFYATAMSILAYLWGWSTNPSTVLSWWLSFMTFTNNLLTALQGYSPVPYTAHLWTIALEEQAYAILPLVLIVFFGSGKNITTFVQTAFVLIGVLILARAAFSIAAAPHPFIWVLPLRADPFIAGVILALVLNGKDVMKPYLLLLGGIILISATIVPLQVEEPGTYQIIGYTTTALGCILIVAATQGKSLFADFLSLEPFKYLGKISYGIYIYHVLCIDISRRFVKELELESAGLENLIAWVVALTLTIIISAVSYALLEKPFLRMKQKYSMVVSRPI